MQRRGEFADAVTAELVGLLDGKLCPPVADHLALFAESAGDDMHLSAAGRVMGDGGAVGDALVVRVGVYEQQPRGLLHGRTIPVVTRRQRRRNPVARSENRWTGKAPVSPKETPVATINGWQSRPTPCQRSAGRAGGARNSKTPSTTRRW